MSLVVDYGEIWRETNMVIKHLVSYKEVEDEIHFTLKCTKLNIIRFN